MSAATKMSADSAEDASASAAIGMPMAYPRSRQNRTVPTVPAARPSGAWSAAAAASTGYISPVDSPRSAPESTRYPNCISTKSASSGSTSGRNRPRYPAPNAATRRLAAPPINPALIGPFRPTRSDTRPARSCESPLRKEYAPVKKSRSRPPTPKPSRAHDAMRPHAMPVSKFAQKPATHTTTRLLWVKDVRANEPHAVSSSDASRARSPATSADASGSPPAAVAARELAKRFVSSSSSLASSTSSRNRPPRAVMAMPPSLEPAPRWACRSDSRSATRVTVTPTSVSASCARNGARVYPSQRHAPTHAAFQSSGVSQRASAPPTAATHAAPRARARSSGEVEASAEAAGDHAHDTSRRSKPP